MSAEADWTFVDVDSFPEITPTPAEVEDSSNRRFARMGVGCTLQVAQKMQKEQFQKERVERKLLGKKKIADVEDAVAVKKIVDSDDEESRSSMISKRKMSSALEMDKLLANTKLSKTQRRRANKLQKLHVEVN